MSEPYVRFRDPSGSVRTGVWLEEEIRAAGRRYDRESVTVLPPCEPTKVVCVGLNYEDHIEETETEVPDRPLLFLKPPSALAAHGDDVRLPAGVETLEYEGEIGVVIGRQGRNVPARRASEMIAGFTCFNDLSNRDDQRVEINWVRGKAFDNAAPVGPVLAPPDRVPPDARIETRVNGETRQASSRDQLLFSVPDLIQEITRYMTLEPGDVIATGTPSGVGPLADGDRVAVEVEGVGTLRHTVTIPED